MSKKNFLVAAGVLTAILGTCLLVPDGEARGKGNPHDPGIVYVISQGLFYDTFVPTELPPKGRFQQLLPGAGPDGVSATDYGPGQPGYVGGRWWVDVNNNGEMDSEDNYVLCPLMGPGRPMP